MSRVLATLALALTGLALIPAAVGAVLDEPEKYQIESASTSLSTTQAGAHPDFTTAFQLNEKEGFPYAMTRDVVVQLPPGIFGNPEAFPKCTTLQLGTDPSESECSLDTQVGSTDITLGGEQSGTFHNEPIYNMPAPGGDVAARFGFFAGPYPVILKVRLDPETQSLVASVEGASAAAALISASTTFWGVPAAASHDPERLTPEEVFQGISVPGGRKSNLPETPFMTNPTSCAVREVTITLISYQLPGAPSSKTVTFPQITGCNLLGFNPTASLAPTTIQATTGSGLDYALDFPTKGLEFGNLNFDSELKRGEVILPEGMTVNPSEAEGLGVCTEADLARETYNSLPNAGCPESAKIGSVIATTPVIDRDAVGSLYLAKPYDNPFASLLALYMVLKVPDRGVLVRLAGKVTTDPTTGRLTTVFDDIPQLPVASFKLHFREGARAPLVTPPACGSYQALSNLNPWSAPGKVVPKANSFAIESGPSHGPCPSGGVPPFHPGLVAGTINNAAGSYSPFNVRLTRTDSEQEITHFSIKLPPGLVGKLAGISFCPDAAIAAAKARTGIHGGEEELAAPSCPQASEVGRTLVGAGVGDVLVYVPGKVYLAGPYHGSALSIVSVTAAKAGPFDLGTVVVREALKINPETAEVFVDATGSDPIPHIIAGIPVRLRDIRVYVDRPEFILNPTNCERTSIASTVLGSGLDFASDTDDQPITVTSPFQAADCASLGFKPKLRLRLRGGTKRGAHPALTATLIPRPGDANIASLSVAFPRSEFLENAHIRTVCTRADFAASACPAGAIYGQATATSPLFDFPLEANVYLRSSSNLLPDVVPDFRGPPSLPIRIESAGRVDSIRGGIRNTFDFIPDAPITRVLFALQGGKKGLLVNSRDICARTYRATVRYTAHNGDSYTERPKMVASCGKAKRGKKKGKRRGHRRAAISARASAR